MITVEEYSEEKYKKIWNEFVVNAKNSLFMHLRNYMDYHKDRFQDNSLLFFDEGKLLALLPANRKKNELFSHGGLTYGGFIINSKMKQHKMIECFAVLKEYMKKKSIAKLIYKAVPYFYFLNPAQEDLYALFVNKAKLLKVEPSTLIDNKNRIKISNGKRGHIVQSKKMGITIEQSNNFDDFIKLENSILEKYHNVRAVHTGTELSLLQSHFPENIKLYIAKYKEEMIAGVVVYLYKNVVHTQYMAANEEARNIGALDLCVNEIISEYAETKQFFDFGISSENAGNDLNEGLIRQKEEFGGRTVVYQTWVMELE